MSFLSLQQINLKWFFDGVGCIAKQHQRLSPFMLDYCNLYLIAQVTDSMTSTDKKTIPALGLAWSNQLTCRLSLSRTGREVDLPKRTLSGALIGGFSTSVRSLEVVFAPHLPNITLMYVIDQEGIKALT